MTAAYAKALTTFALILSMFYGWSIFNRYEDASNNSCELTYMHHTPAFVKINMSDSVKKDFVRYGLYVYAEGKFEFRAKSYKFTGIPVLFIPGNGGSYKQVRSLASITSSKAMDLQALFHYNFFTVDLNEEYSALYGGCWEDQVRFVHHSIDRILEFYENNTIPQSIVIIAHSMGGMIAKALYMYPDFNKNNVKLVVTLATPFEPDLLLDLNLATYYRSVQNYWEEMGKSNATFVSIGGGRKDLLVRPESTIDRNADINVVTSAISGVGLSTDHVSIVWCKNLAKVLARILYDAVDVEAKGITNDPALLRKILNYHLLKKSDGNYFSEDMHHPTLKYSKEDRRVVRDDRGSFFYDSVLREKEIMVKLPPDAKNVIVQAINIVGKRDWIGTCKDDSCTEGENLSQFGFGDYNETYARKYVELNETVLRGKNISGLLVKIPQGKWTGINFEVYDERARTIRVKLDTFLWDWRAALEKTKRGAMRYTLILENTWAIPRWFVHDLRLIPSKCTKPVHLARSVFKTNWAKDDVAAYFTKTISEPLKLVVQSRRPNYVNFYRDPASGVTRGNISVHPMVELTLDPACIYSVSIKSSFWDSLGQLTTRYSYILPVNLILMTFLALLHQLKCLKATTADGLVPEFRDALSSFDCWFTILVAELAIYCFFCVGCGVGFDAILVRADAEDFFYMPFISQAVSYGMLWAVSSLLSSVIYAAGWICNKCKLRECLDQVIQDDIDLAVTGYYATFFFVTCPAISLFVISALYIIKFVCVADLLHGEKAGKGPPPPEGYVLSTFAKNRNELRLHFTMLVIWMQFSIYYIPSVLTWLRNVKVLSLYREEDRLAYVFISGAPILLMGRNLSHSSNGDITSEMWFEPYKWLSVMYLHICGPLHTYRVIGWAFFNLFLFAVYVVKNADDFIIPRELILWP